MSPTATEQETQVELLFLKSCFILLTLDDCVVVDCVVVVVSVEGAELGLVVSEVTVQF